jgi:hypothetical protein
LLAERPTLLVEQLPQGLLDTGFAFVRRQG